MLTVVAVMLWAPSRVTMQGDVLRNSTSPTPSHFLHLMSHLSPSQATATLLKIPMSFTLRRFRLSMLLARAESSSKASGCARSQRWRAMYHCFFANASAREVFPAIIAMLVAIHRDLFHLILAPRMSVYCASGILEEHCVCGFQ